MAQDARDAQRLRETWNPVTGCTKVSPGCKHCYAETLANRLQGIGAPKYARGFALTLHDDALERPRQWKRPRFVFVNSMSDVLHKDVPDDFLHRIFAVMRRTPQHTYMLLTKRSERLREMADNLDWAPNVWMGVSVESQPYAYRIDDLRATGARVKFLSFEPLLGPIEDVDLSGIGWAFVGGESGPRARPMREEWALSLKEQCARAGVAFSFHQWGGAERYSRGRLLDGREWNEMPAFHTEPTPNEAAEQLSLF